MRIVEVGPRDGLQNETAAVPTDAKVGFVNALSETGVDEIEVSSFVSARWVPQLSDAEEVFRRISRKNGVTYSALVPNEIGLDRAVAARVDKVAVITAASDSFNRKNTNVSVAESIRRYRPVVARAKSMNLPVRGYVSAAIWCAFEGRIAPGGVVRVVEDLLAIGVDEISISDTVGKASPDEVKQLLDDLLPVVNADRIAMHFHDTYGRGVENVRASCTYGIRIFDASAGGLGGCPYAPGATGNVATEKVVAALAGLGAPMHVDAHKLRKALGHIAPFINADRRTLPTDGLPACAACDQYKENTCCRDRVND